jgi:ribonuclease HII
VIWIRIARSTACGTPRRCRRRSARLSQRIRRQAPCREYRLGDVEEIDALNILGATLLAMRRAVSGLSLPGGQVDGNCLPDLAGCCARAEAIVRGDAAIAAISAASILAKHARDEVMTALAAVYPGYRFQEHKGYPTTLHLEALRRLGPSPQHRCSFGPVRDAMKSSIR